MPRSNARVRGPFLVSTVNWPYIPPRRRSLTSARRSRRSARRAVALGGPALPGAADEANDASESAPFSTAAGAPDPLNPAAGPGAVPVAAAGALGPGPDTASVTANAPPPATTAHVTITAAARRRGDPRRGRPGPVSTPPSAFVVVMMTSIGTAAGVLMCNGWVKPWNISKKPWNSPQDVCQPPGSIAHRPAGHRGA